VTYSIVARDDATGEFGVAAQSHFFSVGSVLAWAEPGRGVVATQAFVNPSYGPLGLALMTKGATSAEAVSQLIAADPACALRQVAMIDPEGNVAVHTGRGCVDYAGDVTAEQVSAQGNMMATDQVWPSMLSAYLHASGDLAHKLLMALRAGEDAGGDVRGRQSACVLVVTGQTYDEGGRKLVELRVDDHEDPLAELERLLVLHEQYGVLASLLAEGMFDRRLSDAELATAVDRLSKAQHALADGNQEFTFWRGVVLARAGRLEAARAALAEAAEKHAGWSELFRRLPGAGRLPLSPDEVEAVLPA